MAVCHFEKQRALVDAEEAVAKDSVSEKESINKQARPNESQIKVQKAIEATNLCYNCETGFHYIKQ